MSYAVYSFTGIIVRFQNIGDANRLLWLATDTNGLIVVKAQSIRLEKSKLRHACQLFSLVTIEAISGREGWKLTGAEQSEQVDLQNIIYKYEQEIASLAQIIVQLSLEEISEDTIPLYTIITTAANLLGQHPAPTVVLCAKAQIAAGLGYIQKRDYLAVEYITELLGDQQQTKQLTNDVDRALFESQMK